MNIIDLIHSNFQTPMVILFFSLSAFAQSQNFESDVFDTGKGKLTIYFIKHGTLMFDFNGYIIHIDPVGEYADYTKLPKADLILITHEHGDHLDPAAIAAVRKQGTKLVVTGNVYEKIKEGDVMKNGDERTVDGIKIQVVPAYNTTEGHTQFHPKGRDNGYILQLGNKRVYIAGDTEDIPEMIQLKDIDVAFLPVNQPYTMTLEQAARAAMLFQPKILYPYHYGYTNIADLKDMLQNERKINVRVRQLQ